jgi:1,4-dihydroxy-6-naphthoate synthase
MKKTIHVAHSPDSDDAFMFYALANGKISTEDYEFVHHLDDIESLNRAAETGRYEVTALSIHAYAYLADRYALLNSGASMGEDYGPVVVAAEPFDASTLRGRRIAVPGLRTSAYLALRLFERHFHPEVVPFDEIMEAVEAGAVEAGLLIHEGQLSYEDHGLHRVLDLGEWWMRETGLPLPLGGNAIRRDLGAAPMRKISDLIRRSIQYALEHRDEALAYALTFGRGLGRDRGDRFVGMYVNARTLDYGDEGRRAVQLFLDRGFESGVLDRRVPVDFF